MAYKFSLYLFRDNEKININSITCKTSSETKTFYYKDFVIGNATYVWEALSENIEFTVEASNGLSGWYFSSIGKALDSDSINGSTYKYTYKYDSSNTTPVNMRPVPFTGFDLTCFFIQDYVSETNYTQLPIKQLEYKIGTGTWTTYTGSEKSVLIVSGTTKDISLRITPEDDTYIKGWYVSENNSNTGTTNARTDNSTSTSNGKIIYTYSSDKKSDVVNIRPVFYTYAFRLEYKDTPYNANGIQQSSIVAITNGFKKTLSYTFFYPEEQGGKIGGWATDKAGGALVYEGGKQYALTGTDGAQTKIALFKAYKNLPYRIKLSLYKNDGSSTSAFKTFEFGSENSSTIQLTTDDIKSIKEVSPTREGYGFLGYSTDKSATVATYKFTGVGSGNAWKFEGTSTTKNYNLYAVWSKIYYASFTIYSGIGFFSDGSTVKTYEDEVNAENFRTNLPRPEIENYKLIGWAISESDANNGIVTYELQHSFSYGDPKKEYVLYAVWTRIYSYKFIYNSGDGAWADGSTQKKEEGTTTEILYKGYRLLNNTPISNDTSKVFKYWLLKKNNVDIQYEPNSIWPLDFSNSDSIELTFNAQYLSASGEGVVYIGNDVYIPYIYTTLNGVTGWHECEAYVYSSGWKVCIE